LRMISAFVARENRYALCANAALPVRIMLYWSRLREIVMVDSVLVLVQRMSRRR
jgi:hypothetical protein